MGRELDPNLDLWKTAKPYLEKWMHERVGLTGLRKQLDKEAGQWSQLLPEIPRLVHARLSRPDYGPALNLELTRLRKAQQQGNRLLMLLSAIAMVALGLAVWALTQN